ncbi:hypothetical protein AVEN_231665-1 [Araneus ventricosus]|uniref:Uncharacterized protein n=1 Tax=Araneus ventricosus TaxID=182803 RepID=A0A4Y2RRU1_ARAVE|nr:hypothetical protein AVEN_231665-1 [Araneus ventricosus]
MFALFPSVRTGRIDVARGLGKPELKETKYETANIVKAKATEVMKEPSGNDLKHSSGIWKIHMEPYEYLRGLLDFTFQLEEALSSSNQSAAKLGLSSGKSPAVPPPKKILNPSVRPCSDMRFNEIDHMIERSS